jgi:hypothetical protein
MSKPKFLYEIVKGETVAHSDDLKCITLQQADLLGSGPDNHIFLDRANAAAMRDALDAWLAESE